MQPQTTASLLAMPLFRQGKQAVPQHYAEALQAGAQFLPTPDGRSFAVYQPPKNSSKGVIVSLHGHDGWAFTDLAVWQPHLAGKGYGLLGLQWWFGQGEGPADYFTHMELDRNLTALCEQLKIAPQTALLHGFSRGATQTYGLTARDRTRKKPLYLLTVANAGKAAPDYPATLEIARGDFGRKPFAGSHWVLYAGARDSNPERDGIPGMRESRDWLVRLGGTVEKLIEDPTGDHGGFHRNAANTRTALEIFERLLQKNQ